ncbi:MAG: DUF4974 domain-containing protein [Parabacteroides sp.]|nr:DUF4974 domain-containing protein [Parabacteroides sp.]
METTDYIRLFRKFLQKQATPGEVEALVTWLKSENAFHSWMHDEWEAAPTAMNTALQKRIWKQIRVKTERATGQPASPKAAGQTPWPVRLLRVAAVLVLMALTGAGVYFHTVQRGRTADTVVSVEKGQKANILLPDGSKVWVNSGSRLIYGKRFHAGERILKLEGEGYFEVNPDPAHPFIVETDDLSVKALGTSFDIKSYPNGPVVSTVLMSGKVEVRSASETALLEPNQKIVFDRAAGAMKKYTVADATDYSDWRYNILAFEAETFENIVRTLERLYNVRIIFESETLKKYRFTGSPGNASLESILELLSLTSPLQYEIQDSIIVLRENQRDKPLYEKALK